jgi:NAD(P)H-dependent FMN reductase
MLNLHVIVASTRPGRAGPAVADWALARASGHGSFRARKVDLAEVNLPLLDEPNHPRFADYKNAHTLEWSRTVDAADAFVLVTPEYDYSMPATLLNALQYLSREWAYKAVGFVSYGGVSGGTRSVQMAKQVITALKMMPIPEAVAVPFFGQHLTGGVFTPPESHDKAATMMLDELAKWASALKPLRAK